MKIPGLIDPHVHLREPGASYKEDWGTGTKAALAGGFTTVLAMPNTTPPITNRENLQIALGLAQDKAYCDYGQYLGASDENIGSLDDVASQSAGLKMYLDQTYGPLHLENIGQWAKHFASWPANRPIVAHAEGRSMAAIILIAALYGHPIHIAHVSRKEEILIIRKAKEKGYPVTCEVTPHHLFLSEDDIPHLGMGMSEVRPRLATNQDRQALWDNLDVIDCFATDHAPHTKEEKMSGTPPPGFPGLETALPLMLTAVHEGRLTFDAILEKMFANPKRIFGIPDQYETWVEIDPDYDWVFEAKRGFTKAGWSPFEGWRMVGKVRSVTLRGEMVYKDGKILVEPGYGKNIRKS